MFKIGNRVFHKDFGVSVQGTILHCDEGIFVIVKWDEGATVGHTVDGDGIHSNWELGLVEN